MKRIRLENAVIIKEVKNFSLKDTLECGQCFRWNETVDGSFEGIVEGRFCRASQKGDTVTLSGIDPDDFDTFWCEYFDFSRDYDLLREQFGQDPTLAQALCFAPGIRVLRQYPWETLCSYIISQNNNIKRIKGIVARLCEAFGDPLADGSGWSFPSAERLAALKTEDLAPIRCGFRAKYIIDAATKVASGELVLEKLYRMDLEEARTKLMTIKGVGPKVAECTLLYGLGRVECFPLDVWMKRAMAELFPNGLPDCAVKEAGIAQQYIFHYMRMRG
ncbi:MAG: DNA-3-methyladenine glycosylase 2 family protein [Ruminococcaceae bacterium]|nr:DNA-3-methyladenine glycosylase 2 family protein [Oscillospiraceae bacterium]MBE7064155.1 DNA-3-methyladenine glycosylase 2 family protein [Oscillospiraceae bacterium]